MNLHNPGHALHKFREQTAGQAPCAGVMRPSFICKLCTDSFAVQGRRQLVKGVSKLGYICRECAEARDARKAKVAA